MVDLGEMSRLNLSQAKVMISAASTICLITAVWRPTAHCVKGMYLAPDIHEHFTTHKWLRQTAYILTHNFNNLEHIANNCMSAMTHTDVTTAHH